MAGQPAPVVPATQEGEAGELFEPRQQRLQWADIMPLYSSLGNRARLYLKKRKRNWVMMEEMEESLSEMENK